MAQPRAHSQAAVVVPEPPPNEPDLSYGDKQAALQAKRRFVKLRAHNQKALHGSLHVISAAQLLGRPARVVCGTQRRKGHWLRLAQTPCPKHDLLTCRDLIQREDRAIQDRLDKIETLTAQKTVQPDIVADFERKRVAKAKAESDMTIDEALKLPYKRVMREFWPPLFFKCQRSQSCTRKVLMYFMFDLYFAGVSDGLFLDTATFACSCAFLVLV